MRQVEAAGGAAVDTVVGPGTASAGLPPKPPEPVPEPVGVPPEPRMEDPLKVSDIDKINQNSPFQPVFFPTTARRSKARASRC